MRILLPKRYLLFNAVIVIISMQLLLTCSSDQQGIFLELSDNQIGWFVNDQPTFPKEVRCSWISKDNEERISITGFTGSEGVMVLVHAQSEKIEGEYKLEGKNSVMLNEKKDGALAVFLSGACKPVTGKIVITDHDKRNETISGHFEANLCAKGRFILYGNTAVKGGQFKNVKYLRTIK